MKKNYILYTLALLSILIYACKKSNNEFSVNDLKIINEKPLDSLLYIFNINKSKDTIVLRDKSYDLSLKEIQSSNFKTLSRRMINTVTDSTVNGVGLAAPQIGINKRIVAVQRFDKKGFPFEVYPNVHITKLFGEKKWGREGCLSVPNKNAEVLRNDSLILKYINPSTYQEKIDTIGGFTAVIFQHEVDHLEGIIYLDRPIKP